MKLEAVAGYDARLVKDVLGRTRKYRRNRTHIWRAAHARYSVNPEVKPLLMLSGPEVR